MKTIEWYHMKNIVSNEDNWNIYRSDIREQCTYILHSTIVSYINILIMTPWYVENNDYWCIYVIYRTSFHGNFSFIFRLETYLLNHNSAYCLSVKTFPTLFEDDAMDKSYYYLILWWWISNIWCLYEQFVWILNKIYGRYWMMVL